jgi:hypothetical protein
MPSDKRIARRLVGLFLLGALLFNFPLLSLFNRQVLVFGIPILYLYIFAAWSLIIFLVLIISRSRPGPLLPEK